MIGNASEQTPGRNSAPLIANMAPPSDVDDLSGVAGLAPRYALRRSAHAAHHWITDDVDAEMFGMLGPGIMNFRGAPSWVKTEKEEGGDEPAARLNELAKFDLFGFSQFYSMIAVDV